MQTTTAAGGLRRVVRGMTALLAVVVVAISGCIVRSPAGGADVAATPSPAADGGTGPAAASTEPAPMPPHDYVYNLPHRVPPDYVYRTERIFSATVPGGGKPGKTEEAVATPEETAAFAAAIDELAGNLIGQGDLDADARVIVATFVNLDDLYRTSGLGRLLQEETIGALRRAGMDIIDVRKTPSMLVKRRFGEYGLSRDLEEIPYVHLADAVLVGTYRRAAGRVFINARLLDNADNRVLGVAETVLPVSPLVEDLLTDEKTVPARRALPVPVRGGER